MDEDEDIFPIMELPIELRAKIFQMVTQRAVPGLRLVCQQWRREIDQFYEFSVNIYDTASKHRHLRCRECIIWRLTQTLDDDETTVLDHPGYLKTIKIYGPIQAEILQNLISSTINLEHLTVTRRANYPKILNLKDTPSLSHLTRLKYLRLNSEEHILIAPRFALVNEVLNLPMMDCYFPSLKHFEILKRFPNWNLCPIVTVILKFVSRHARTLETLELDLIPLSSIPHPASDSDDSMDDDDGDAEERAQRRAARLQSQTDLSHEAINLESLCNLRLQKCCVTTKGSNKDVRIWKSVLERQDILKELRFDWLCNDPRAEILARVTGFPWVFFRAPISNCATTLMTVELTNLSMMAKDNVSSSRGHTQILPFDLRIFRSCSKLKNLILRCRENHGRVDQEDEGQDEEDFPQAEPEEVLLMINGSELPESIESLELRSFPMVTEDILAIIRKCPLLKKLFLKECGKTRNLGVTASVIREMSNLVHLKFLEVIGFNDSTVESRRDLELIFRALGLPYEGQETWLEFDHGNSSAHDALKQLNEPL